jgi:hypothetical protein
VPEPRSGGRAPETPDWVASCDVTALCSTCAAAVPPGWPGSTGSSPWPAVPALLSSRWPRHRARCRDHRARGARERGQEHAGDHDNGGEGGRPRDPLPGAPSPAISPGGGRPNGRRHANDAAQHRAAGRGGCRAHGCSRPTRGEHAGRTGRVQVHRADRPDDSPADAHASPPAEALRAADAGLARDRPAHDDVAGLVTTELAQSKP